MFALLFIEFCFALAMLLVFYKMRGITPSQAAPKYTNVNPHPYSYSV